MEVHVKWSATLVDWLCYVWLWDLNALLTRKLPMFFVMFDWDFDRESWETISNSDHRSATDKVWQDKTPSDAQKFASMTGACYSVLFQLTHYDAVRFELIDPMHNLLLTSRRTGYAFTLFLHGKEQFQMKIMVCWLRVCMLVTFYAWKSIWVAFLLLGL